jgi:hypothetical protein
VRADGPDGGEVRLVLRGHVLQHLAEVDGDVLFYIRPLVWPSPPGQPRPPQFIPGRWPPAVPADVRIEQLVGQALRPGGTVGLLQKPNAALREIPGPAQQQRGNRHDHAPEGRLHGLALPERQGRSGICCGSSERSPVGLQRRLPRRPDGPTSDP